MLYRLLACLALAGTAFGQSIVLLDPFTHTGGAAGTFISDVNTNIPARQAGGLLTTTYTKALSTGAQANLEESAAPFAGDDVINLRTAKQAAANAASIAVQSALKLDTNFGPQLAGKKWSVSFVGRMQQNNSAINDAWTAISVGDGTTTAGPNNAATDVGILVRYNKGFQVFLDNVGPANGGLTFTSTTATAFPANFWAVTWTLTLYVDETISPVSVTARLVSGAAEHLIGPWTTTFENSTNRTFEIRAHQGGNNAAPAGALMDARINDLKIEVTTPPAIPQVLAPVTASQSLWVGEAAQLSVQAWGQAPLTYSWTRNGTPVPGAATSTLSLASPGLGDDGTYVVTVANANGSATSTGVVNVIYPTPQQRTYETMGPCSRRSGFVFSEIMYRMSGLGRIDLGFVELHNTHPWPEDISGFRLSGDVDYVFPTGTIIGAKGFLVVAENPGAISFTYPGVTSLGPWAGHLGGSGGSLRLRSRADAILVDAAYDTNDRWPQSAEGPGHSLVLARPSRGGSSVDAWEASALRGGSPGTADPVPAGVLRHVSIGEVVAGSHLVLANNSPLTIDITGCGLSDSSSDLKKLTLPATTLAPGATLALTEAQLGFPLPEIEQTYYFTNPSSTAVISAMKCRPRADPQVRITEIAAAPASGLGTDQWIEVLNDSGSPIDLAGWKISDGINFTFPAPTLVPAGSHVIVAKDPARFLTLAPAVPAASVLGPFSGALDKNGERIGLSMPGATPAAPMRRVDEVVAPAVPDTHAGHTMERISVLRDGLAANNWRPTAQTAGTSWSTVEVTGLLDLNHAGVPDVTGVQLFLMGDGECLVDDVEVLDNAGTPALLNGGFESGLGSWVPEGNQVATLAPGLGTGGGAALRLVATGGGGPDGNRVRCALTTPLTPGATATVRAKVKWLRGAPEFIVRLRGGWLEAFGTLARPALTGTPMTSPPSANAAAALVSMTTRPVLPPAGLPFRVMAQLDDVQSISHAWLNYRLDPATATTQVVMHDDGLDGDLMVGDNIWTGSIPAQAAGTLVAWTVTAQNDDGEISTFPGTSAPALPPVADEFLVRVGDPVQTGDFGTYRFWMTQASVTTWASRPKFNNNPLPMTFVYGDQRVVHGARGYYSGSEATTPGYSSPVGGLCAYNLALPPGVTVLDAEAFNIDWPVRDTTDQREQLMFWFASQLKLPSMYRRYVNLYANGVRRGVINDDVQRPGQDVLDEHYSDDAGGALHKSNNYVELTDAGARIDPATQNYLLHYDSPAGSGQHKLVRYRWNWRPRATSTQNDFTELFGLIDAVNTTGPGYQAAMTSRVATAQWMRTFAFFDLCSYWDSVGNGNKKNTYLYKPKRSGWELISYDMDVGLGVFNDPVNAGLFSPAGADPALNLMQSTPAFQREYWRCISEAFSTFFTGDTSGSTYQLLQAKWAALQQVPGLVSPFSVSGAYGLSIPQWITDRRAFIQAAIPAGATTTPFAVTSPATGATVTEGNITLTGTAPVTTATLTCNGLPLAPAWSSLTAWTAPFVLHSGPNTLVVKSWDGNGLETGSVTLDLTFSGVNAWPALRITEWLATNSNPGGNADPEDGDYDDWFELYNPTGTAVDLGGWYLTDTLSLPRQFIIPAGTTIPANGRLLCWADSEILQTLPATRPDLHVNFRLSGSGDSIALSAPDDTLIDSVTFGAQTANVSQGRWAGSGATVVTLDSPTPGTANVFTPPAPVYTTHALATGGGVDLAWTALPGASYRIRRSPDLADWTALATVTPATAAGAYTDPAPPATRVFYVIELVLP